MIEFQAVTKQYPDGTVAVDNLDLAVEDGGITVFVGPSGCGKTTSLRMINRMIDPTGGRILLDGEDIRESDPPLLRRGIGYVIQHAGLFPHRTILDNIATVPQLTGATRRAARARAGARAPRRPRRGRRRPRRRRTARPRSRSGCADRPGSGPGRRRRPR